MAQATAEAAGTAIHAPGALDASRPLRILVGYDGGRGSRDALALVKALCESSEAELTIASVRPVRSALAEADLVPAAIREDVSSVRRSAADALGSDRSSVKVMAGADEIAGLKELAETENSDLIVIGSSDRGAPGRVGPGSVGEGVLDGAPCAVAIAPQGLAEGDPAIREIAVGYDGSRASTVALRRAVGLAERCHASLLVLGAVEITLGLAGYETQGPKDARRGEMERHLRRAVEMASEAVPARSRVLFGPPAETILDAAKEADLLVLGSRGSYGVLRRLMLGSVGAAAVRRASCPILVTPTDY